MTIEERLLNRIRKIYNSWIWVLLLTTILTHILVMLTDPESGEFLENFDNFLWPIQFTIYSFIIMIILMLVVFFYAKSNHAKRKSIHYMHKEVNLEIDERVANIIQNRNITDRDEKAKILHEHKIEKNIVKENYNKLLEKYSY